MTRFSHAPSGHVRVLRRSESISCVQRIRSGVALIVVDNLRATFESAGQKEINCDRRHLAESMIIAVPLEKMAPPNTSPPSSVSKFHATRAHTIYISLHARSSMGWQRPRNESSEFRTSRGKEQKYAGWHVTQVGNTTT